MITPCPPATAGRRLASLPKELLECGDVEQLDRASLHLEQAFLLKARKEPAHGSKS